MRDLKFRLSLIIIILLFICISMIQSNSKKTVNGRLVLWPTLSSLTNSMVAVSVDGKKIALLYRGYKEIHIRQLDNKLDIREDSAIIKLKEDEVVISMEWIKSGLLFTTSGATGRLMFVANDGGEVKTICSVFTQSYINVSDDESLVMLYSDEYDVNPGCVKVSIVTLADGKKVDDFKVKLGTCVGLFGGYYPLFWSKDSKKIFVIGEKDLRPVLGTISRSGKYTIFKNAKGSSDFISILNSYWYSIQPQNTKGEIALITGDSEAISCPFTVGYFSNNGLVREKKLHWPDNVMSIRVLALSNKGNILYQDNRINEVIDGNKYFPLYIYDINAEKSILVGKSPAVEWVGSFISNRYLPIACSSENTTQDELGYSYNEKVFGMLDLSF